MEDPKQTPNLDDESWMNDMGWGDDEPVADATTAGGLSPEALAAEAAVAEEEAARAASLAGTDIGAVDLGGAASVVPQSTPVAAPINEPEPVTAAAIAATSAAFAPFPGSGQDGNGQGIDLLLDVSLQVSVELGRTRMKIGEILGLRSGSVIELDRLAGEPADILVNGTLIAKGEVVVVDEKFGVRIIEFVSRAKRLASLA